MKRLNKNVLEQLTVSVPRYDRESLQAGIVHLGIGAFHRGHQADYTDRAIGVHGGDWGIVGASLRSPGIRDLLQPQDGLYSLIENDGEHQNIRVIGAVQEVLVATEDPGKLIETLSDPSIKVVTLTVTEKGYCHDPATGAINWQHPDIVHDLEHYRTQPRSAIGFLAAALAKRQAHNAPVTLLSCDNLSHNGRLLERVLKAFVERVQPDLRSWLATAVTFPCSMVDRIVPAVTDEDLERLADKLGAFDAGAVFTEPFSQWVIEDHFASQRPCWEAVGALLVADVSPFEDMKLRLLNGSHSLIAYLGVLAGYEFVHEVMDSPRLQRLVRQFMDTVTHTLTIPAGFDVEQYKNQLCDRFANSSLRHKTAQIAMDGSQKIPQRWLPPLRQMLQQGSDVSLFALALAGWIRFLGGRTDSGQQYRIDDPLSESLHQRLQNESPCAAILGYSPVFGELACEYPDFVRQVSDCYSDMKTTGILKALP